MRAALLLSLAACAGADTGPDTGSEPCTDRPQVSWDGFADGFFGGYCRPCHSAGAPDRYGAPESVNFDTEAEARALAGSVQRVVLEEGIMPIGGGVTAGDAALLSAWLDCTEAPE